MCAREEKKEESKTANRVTATLNARLAAGSFFCDYNIGFDRPQQKFPFCITTPVVALFIK